MKRLVVCCDGTWNSADRPAVSNVEKIALAVETSRPVTPTSVSVQQEVLYVTGVGTRGYWADRVLGGMAGAGLTANVNEAYRWLCVNYDPGDEIFLFGFSRGAYTARSVGGMISTVGLLDPGRLDPAGFGATLLEAEQLYRLPTAMQSRRVADFRRDHARTGVSIRFVGVFDTVGALGIPGPSRQRMKFHNVTLGPTVQHARQALAIDERRMTFEPCVWTIDETLPEEQRPHSVKQVWFEGVHSDVGGGYPADESGLSEISLAWMVTEAGAAGLVFEPETLAAQFDSDASDRLHDSLSAGYRMINLARNTGRRLTSVLPTRSRSGAVSGRFRDSRRVLALPPDPRRHEHLYLASTAERAYRETTYHREAPNIGWWYDLSRADHGTIEIAPVTDHPDRAGDASRTVGP